MNYEQETRDAYKSRDRAAAYKAYHTSDLSWGRISTRLEQRGIRRLLGERRWSADDRLLDAPCGTGILGSLLSSVPGRIVASDISMEMMALAGDAYDARQLTGFVQADITATPFANGQFAGIVTIGFMHRVPASVRQATLAELHRLCGGIAIVSFSFTSPAQKLKHAVLRALTRRHIPAPHATPRPVIEREIADAGFRVARRIAIAPFLSAESLYLLERVSR